MTFRFFDDSGLEIDPRSIPMTKSLFTDVMTFIVANKPQYVEVWYRKNEDNHEMSVHAIGDKGKRYVVEYVW